jgi:pumilio family protein 6
MIKTLEETDPVRDQTSKKDVETRREEVRKAASGDLVQFLEKRDNAKALVSNAASSLVVTEIMLFADGGKYNSLSSVTAI